MIYFLLDYICAILVRILNLIFHFLPIHFTLWIGRRIGSIIYYVNSERRVIAHANIRAAFSQDKTPQDIKVMVKKTYKSLAETFFEILSLTKIDREYIDKYIEVINIENGLRIANNPQGVILLSAHYGNWELSAMACALKGFPLVVLAREQKMKRLNELLNRLRESKGLTVVRKGITTKYIVKSLHEGNMIGIVGDQDAGKSSVFIEFFGRPASMAPGAARIAQKTGAYLLPAFMARKKGPYHRAMFEEPVKIEKEEDIKPYVEKYTGILEKHIREFPDQWLWLHKKWKSSPLKKVIILSDGKAGHLNQALAVSKELKRYREDWGSAPSDTQIEVLEIKFKNKFMKALLNAISIFSNSNCQGCMRCLKACLTKDSYENLIHRYADIIISCGWGVSGVNRIFSIENNAKSAVIMKPANLKFNKFDIVIIPKHDGRSTRDGSVIATDTVPNLIDEEYLMEASTKISAITNLERPMRIGVLLGGDNKDFMLTSDMTKSLLNNVVDAARKLDADLLFTTSRRTPKENEEIVKERLRSEKHCKLLVIANEKNMPDVVGGILGLSNIIIVSGESVSMVSEAVQSGKMVIVFRLKKKRTSRSKFERMLENLEEKGYVVVADVERLFEVIEKNSRFAKGQKRPPEDRFNIYKYMWRLL